MRRIASLAAGVHRILVRGGLLVWPRGSGEPPPPGRPRLLHAANPLAMVVEAAGGAASTGRERLLEVQPADIHQRVPVILGSKGEVERLVRYHREHELGLDRPYTSPLFGSRTLFTE
jgi:fructose-1,6-bisphosphatase I/sedoheptulose-1,7-bisphosphatase